MKREFILVASGSSASVWLPAGRQVHRVLCAVFYFVSFVVSVFSLFRQVETPDGTRRCRQQSNLLHRTINYPEDIAAYSHFGDLLVFSIGINAVGKENVHQLLFRIGPGDGAGKTLVAKT